MKAVTAWLAGKPGVGTSSFLLWVPCAEVVQEKAPNALISWSSSCEGEQSSHLKLNLRQLCFLCWEGRKESQPYGCHQGCSLPSVSASLLAPCPPSGPACFPPSSSHSHTLFCWLQLPSDPSVQEFSCLMLQEVSWFLEILGFCRVGKLNQLRGPSQGQGITKLLGNLKPKTPFILLKQDPRKQLIWRGNGTKKASKA